MKFNLLLEIERLVSRQNIKSRAQYDIINVYIYYLLNLKNFF
jgi:hypothetical protein